MSDVAYVYGFCNGDTYREMSVRPQDTDRKTHWDPRISVQSIAGLVQVGIVPASDKSTDDNGVWDNDDGQFLSLSRDGLNRLIRSLQDAGRDAFGTDAW